MTLELGGTVNIACEKTGYSATIEFKLKVRGLCMWAQGELRKMDVALTRSLFRFSELVLI